MREILEGIAALAIIVLQIVNMILSKGLEKKVDDQNVMIRSRLSGSEQK